MATLPYINIGGQTVTFRYKNPGTAAEFTKLLHAVISPGIYSGGTVASFIGNNIIVNSFEAAFEAAYDKTVVIKTATSANISSYGITITSATPYIVMRYNFRETLENYIEFDFVATPLIYDLVIGKAIFTGVNVTSIDYTEASYAPTYNKTTRTFSIPNTTPTTSPITGALVVGGGIGTQDLHTADLTTSTMTVNTSATINYTPSGVTDAIPKSYADAIDTKYGAFKRQKTYNTKHGFWGDVFWASTSTIQIRPKKINGLSWIGAILNNGKYLETSSNITVTLDTNTLDGIGAIQNSSWYILYGYEDSGGNLAFKLGYMPYTTLSASNPTTTVTLTQLNSKDVKYLFPIGTSLTLYSDTSKFETEIYSTASGFSTTKTNMTVTSYPGANQITLASSLQVTTFPSTTTKVYQCDGYQPYDCNTGSINSVIGSRGWFDTGIRIYSNVSGGMYNFLITENIFLFANGTGSADSYLVDLSRFNLFTTGNSPTTYYNYFIAAAPYDKKNITLSWCQNEGLTDRAYWVTYGEYVDGGGGTATPVNLSVHTHVQNKKYHGIHSIKPSDTPDGETYSTLGYFI